MFLLKLSIRPWRRSPWSQIFTSAAVGILLFLAGFLFWMQRGMGPVIERLQGEQVITAYLDPSLSPEGETDVVDTIRSQVGAHAEIELVGTDRFLAHLRGDYPELANELENLGAEMQTVIPRYVSVSGMFGPDILDQVKDVRGVQSAESSVDRFRNVIGAFRALKWIATLLGFGLALALMTALVHLSRTNAYLHEGSASLMRLLGAGPAALRAPAFICGALVGLLGGIFASIAWNLVGAAMTGHFRELSPILNSMPHAGQSWTGGLVLAGLALGAVSGVLGNWLGESAQANGS